MPKRPIEWYEECLRYSEESLANAEARLAREQASVERMRNDNAFRRAQIQEAKARGMEAFDAERLLRKVRR